MTDSNATLLPCPFCGDEALVQPTYDIDTNECDGFFVWCSNYDCECKPQTRDYQTEAEAIVAWNTRAERTCHMEMAEGCQNWNSCSVCDADYYTDQKINYCPNCGAKVIGG